MKGRKLVNRSVASQVRMTVGGRYSDNEQPTVYAYAGTDRSFDGTEYESLELRVGDGATTYEFCFFLAPGMLARIRDELDRVLERAKKAAVA